MKHRKPNRGYNLVNVKFSRELVDNWAVILKYPLHDDYTISEALLLPFQRTFIIRMAQYGIKDNIMKMNIISAKKRFDLWPN